MKKIFFRPNNTIRMEAVYSTLAIIATVCVVVIYLLSKLGKGVTYQDHITTTTAKKTTTIALCKDCSFSFNELEIRVKPEHTYLMKDLMTTQNITFKTIKFTVDDSSIIKVETAKSGDIVLTTLNKVGHAKVVAKYGDIETSMNVVVSQTDYNSAIFKNNTYYVYQGSVAPIELLTDPEGAPASTFVIDSSNTDIASINVKNELVGNFVGESKIHFNYKNVDSNALVYVIKNRMTIKVKEKDTYNYYDEYKYVSSYDGIIELEVNLEDKDNIQYDNTNITFEVENHGNLKLNVSYYDKSIYEPNSYIYKVQVDTVETTPDSKPKVKTKKNVTENYSYIIFTLSDGSKSRIKISR